MDNGVDLEKERVLFEQWFVTKYPYTQLDRDNGVVGTYWHERVEMSWQSWLSSINREGYKSQQVKIDELQARIDATEKWIESNKETITLEYSGYTTEEYVDADDLLEILKGGSSE